MGSAFSSYIDRSQCRNKHAFEEWNVAAVAAAACKAYAVARHSGAFVPLRKLRLNRVQFHNVFVDFSCILPFVGLVLRQSAEFAAAEKAAQLGASAPIPDEETTEREKVAAQKDFADRMEAMATVFRGMKDEIFDMFLDNAELPQSELFAAALPMYSDDTNGIDSAGVDSGGATPKPTSSNGTPTIRALEVFAVLALMCKGSVAQKISLLYHLVVDEYKWEESSVACDVWLLSDDPCICADSASVTASVEQLVDLFLSVSIAMRRVGMSVADVSLAEFDFDAAHTTLPKGSSIVAKIEQQKRRGARRFLAAIDLVAKSAKATMLLRQHSSRKGLGLTADPAQPAGLSVVVATAQAQDAHKKLLMIRKNSIPEDGVSLDSPITPEVPRRLVSADTRQRLATGTKFDEHAYVRLQKLRDGMLPGLDDDLQTSTASMYARQLVDAHDSVKPVTKSLLPLGRCRFRLTNAIINSFKEMEMPNIPTAADDRQKRITEAIDTVAPPLPNRQASDPSNVSDVGICLGLVASMLEAPERWRRMTAAKRRVLGNLPGFRSIRVATITWDHYKQANEHIRNLAHDIIDEVHDALHARKLVAAIKSAVVAQQLVSPRRASMNFVDFETGPPVPAPTIAALHNRRQSESGTSTPSRFTPVPSRRASIHHPADMTNAGPYFALQADLALERYASLFRVPVPLTLLFDWLVTHPIARYLCYQLCFPLGRIATYDGLHIHPPRADARTAVADASGQKAPSKLEMAKLLSKMCLITGLDVPAVREFRKLLIETSGSSAAVPVEAFRRVFADFMARFVAARKEAVMVYNVKKAMGTPVEGPAPYVPRYSVMPEASRKRFHQNFIDCLKRNSDGMIDLISMTITLARLVPGEAAAKLSLLFDLYDADGDGDVTMQELGYILIGVFKLSDGDNEEDASAREQEDFQFARELTTALDVNRDGSISREEFFEVLRREPIMYECFAAALHLPIGGFDAENQMDIVTAAKSGPIFDFSMLRTIHEKYSIDLSKNRGVERKKKGSKGRRGSVIGVELHHAEIPTEAAAALDLDAEGKPVAKDASNQASILERAVDRHHFRRLLRDVWRCPEDALFLADRVFDYMDADGSGSIDVRELYEGITAALRGSIETRANFFYSLFDMDGSGHLKSNEILRMLLASAGTESISEEDGRRVLQKIDADGSGTVERQEFIDVVTQDPNILDSLSRVFGHTGGSIGALFKADDVDGLEAEFLAEPVTISAPIVAETIKEEPQVTEITPKPTEPTVTLRHRPHKEITKPISPKLQQKSMHIVQLSPTDARMPVGLAVSMSSVVQGRREPVQMPQKPLVAVPEVVAPMPSLRSKSKKVVIEPEPQRPTRPKPSPVKFEKPARLTVSEMVARAAALLAKTKKALGKDDEYHEDVTEDADEDFKPKTPARKYTIAAQRIMDETARAEQHGQMVLQRIEDNYLASSPARSRSPVKLRSPVPKAASPAGVSHHRKPTWYQKDPEVMKVLSNTRSMRRGGAGNHSFLEDSSILMNSVHFNDAASYTSSSEHGRYDTLAASNSVSDSIVLDSLWDDKSVDRFHDSGSIASMPTNLMRGDDAIPLTVCLLQPAMHRVMLHERMRGSSMLASSVAPEGSLHSQTLTRSPQKARGKQIEAKSPLSLAGKSVVMGSPTKMMLNTTVPSPNPRVSPASSPKRGGLVLRI